ncbi:MAG: hypothetical protein KC609_01120 [Myxococcales bacterium]|nr:hypothetical protein [Myxococcales bacterium]
MGRLRLYSLVAVAIGLVSGTLSDRTPKPEAVTRGAYRVLEGDFHAHTRFSDGFLSPFGLVLQASRRELDVIGVTEHNYVFPGLLARWFSRLIDGPIVLPGSEITRRGYHVIVLGQTRRVDPDLPLSEQLIRVHAQGALAIAAHPVRKFWPALVPLVGEFDGCEVMHPIAFRGDSPTGWRWSDMVEFYRKGLARNPTFAAIGSSDYHFFSPLGVVRTLLFVRSADEAGVIEAIRKGKTVTFGPHGERFGPAELLKLLDREPYRPRTSDYHYRGRGVLDVAGRTLAFLGFLGFCFLGGRRRRMGA